MGRPDGNATMVRHDAHDVREGQADHDLMGTRGHGPFPGLVPNFGFRRRRRSQTTFIRNFDSETPDALAPNIQARKAMGTTKVAFSFEIPGGKL